MEAHEHLRIHTLSSTAIHEAYVLMATSSDPLILFVSTDTSINYDGDENRVDILPLHNLILTQCKYLNNRQDVIQYVVTHTNLEEEQIQTSFAKHITESILERDKVKYHDEVVNCIMWKTNGLRSAMTAFKEPENNIIFAHAIMECMRTTIAPDCKFPIKFHINNLLFDISNPSLCKVIIFQKFENSGSKLMVSEVQPFYTSYEDMEDFEHDSSKVMRQLFNVNLELNIFELPNASARICDEMKEQFGAIPILDTNLNKRGMTATPNHQHLTLHEISHKKYVSMKGKGILNVKELNNDVMFLIGPDLSDEGEYVVWYVYKQLHPSGSQWPDSITDQHKNFLTEFLFKDGLDKKCWNLNADLYSTLMEDEGEEVDHVRKYFLTIDISCITLLHIKTQSDSGEKEHYYFLNPTYHITDLLSGKKDSVEIGSERTRTDVVGSHAKIEYSSSDSGDGYDDSFDGTSESSEASDSD